jgi:hypothetical protein
MMRGYGPTGYAAFNADDEKAALGIGRRRGYFLVERDLARRVEVGAGLNGEKLSAWLGKLRRRAVILALPKFKLETDYGLHDTLKNMGMKRAFDARQADFSGMSASRNPDDQLFISKVLHKAFVEVNEKGAEAAAATAVIMVPKEARPETRPFIPEFRADRPFLFLIRDRESGPVVGAHCGHHEHLDEKHELQSLAHAESPPFNAPQHAAAFRYCRLVFCVGAQLDASRSRNVEYRCGPLYFLSNRSALLGIRATKPVDSFRVDECAP